MLQGRPPLSDAGVLELPFQSEPREALKQSSGALVLTREVWVGLRICIFSKFPSDTEAAGALL